MRDGPRNVWERETAVFRPLSERRKKAGAVVMGLAIGLWGLSYVYPPVVFLVGLLAFGGNLVLMPLMAGVVWILLKAFAEASVVFHDMYFRVEPE